ncbi:undecaprenyl-diphosphate phosphatase [Paraferrimonas sp. SM1919]|uniref:undecaprenyl-diphosphate phosphatase n=1 Tax=Paraferrimonas sp. SM1919 TaxID=2662263 RepID=UPI0013D2CE7C|nr:undecaprenyl-diphosphate phosphatase [Paraferrimonas sp. SM1919]
MEFFEIFWLALLQGLTEFLPISSSAHLILPSQILGWQDQGMAFDVAVHVGTLAAVMIYFRKEVGELLFAWFASLKGKHSPESKLAWLIILATIPAIIAGLLASDLIDLLLRGGLVIAASTLIFGALLWWADRNPAETKDEYDIGVKQALIIGLCQALAMIPGTSRSGITITAALMLGLNRVAAARFSFLLSIPTIMAAGSYMGLKWATSGEGVSWSELGWGALLSFVSAYFCIHFFLKIISKMGMTPFVIYRMILGFVLLYMFL